MRPFEISHEQVQSLLTNPIFLMDSKIDRSATVINLQACDPQKGYLLKFSQKDDNYDLYIWLCYREKGKPSMIHEFIDRVKPSILIFHTKYNEEKRQIMIETGISGGQLPVFE